jgi:hypothetical protein
MKPNGTIKFLNKQPHLLFSHKDLSRVKHIVSLAPQEAQWFHCVERIVQKNQVYYSLTEMLIPEQYCSAAEVDTSSKMMVSFYKQLKEQFGEETNDLMSKMTCWCHSHHNMGVSPSGQDRKQFDEQIKLAQDRGSTQPQVMIIFNKKNEYYCRIYDPTIDLYVENAPLVLSGYDFSQYTEISKKNFKKRAVVKRKPTRSLPHLSGSQSTFLDWDIESTSSSWGSKKKVKMQTRREATSKEMASEKYLLDDEILDYIEVTMTDSQKDIFMPFLTELEEKATTDYNKLCRQIEQQLTTAEIIAFDLLLSGKEEDIRILEHSFPDEISAGNMDTEEYLISLYEFFSENQIDEQDFFIAMSVAKLLTASTVTLPQSEHLVDYWLDHWNVSSNKYTSWYSQ